MNNRLSVQVHEGFLSPNPDSVPLHLLQNPDPDDMLIIGKDADKSLVLETAEKLMSDGFPPENIAPVSDFD